MLNIGGRLIEAEFPILFYIYFGTLIAGRLIEAEFPILFYSYFGTLIARRLMEGGRLMKVQL